MKFWFHILKESNSQNTILLLTFFITIMGLLSPIFIIHIFNRYIAFGLQGTLFFLLSGALLVAVFEYIFRNIRSKILCELLINPIKFFKLDLIKTFFERENKTSKRNFVEIIDFNNNFFQFLSPKVQSNLLDSIFATLIIIILFFLDLLLATIFLILVIIFLLLQQRLIKNKNLNLEKLNLSKNDKLIIKEIGTNQELLKSTLAFKYSGYYLENYLNKKLKIDSSTANFDAQQISTTSFFVLLSSIITIGFGSIFVVNGNLSIGSLIGFNIFATRALGTISSAQNSYSIIERTNMYLNDCQDFFKNSKNRVEGMQLSKIIGNYKLKNVNYSFDNDNKYIINNFSANFNSSEISVISGANGSGKTTIAKLLMGLINPESGDILLDETNLEKLSLQWYKNQVAYIPEDVEVLNSSILNNILISNPDLNEQEVSRLLQNVGLDKELKKSDLTITDSINKNYSKGILKKIHIARSISKTYQVYIFDDPLLYLDKLGKNMILKLIASLKRAGKTVICFSEDSEIIKLSDKQTNLG